MPFGDYADRWLVSRETAGELAAKTLERYRGIVRDHLVPHMGGRAARPLLGRARARPRRSALRVRHDRKKGRLSE
jgi:hypothetical protein